ncbi:MAG: DUF368 domain-containing protein [Candidatus Zapsychrus exili]|nr:DUF368 domain-containing protein [Candidatus Zapsychrus exili]
MNFIKLFLKGIAIGIANIIPGVSGGTLAFIFGIYEELITSIKAFDLKLIKILFVGAGSHACPNNNGQPHGVAPTINRFKFASKHINLKFLFPILLGAFFAIISLSRAMIWSLESYPVLVNSFFFGLILATVPMIINVGGAGSHACPNNNGQPQGVAPTIAFIVSLGVMLAIVSLSPAQTPDALWFIFLAGALAISTMILPGISGSFILVILGKYHFILNAINERDLVVLAVFSLGMVVGIILFVRLLSFLFKKYHDITIASIAGIVVGSLVKIWPWKEVTESIVSRSGKIIIISQNNILPNIWGQSATGDSPQFLLAVVFMVLGLVVVMALNKK